MRFAIPASAQLSGPDWTTASVVTGNPVAVDPSPNVTPPAANRTYAMDFSRVGAVYRAAQLGTVFDVVGGTSIKITMWFFDNALGVWVQFGGVGGIAVASENNSSASLLAIPGALWFPQIVTVTGAVTSVRYVVG